MKKRDTSYKFEAEKNYCIGTMQSHCLPSEAPTHISKNPAPIQLTGGTLIESGFKTVNQYLQSPMCKFQPHKTVCFWEVSVENGDEKYTLITSGTPMPIVNKGLSDQLEAGHNFSPSSENEARSINFNPVFSGANDATAKEYAKSYGAIISQFNEQIARKDEFFAIKQDEWLKRIDEQNTAITQLNIELNNIKTEKDGLQIRYDEVAKMNEKLLEIQATPPPIIEHEEPQQSLADKAVSTLDTMLGDGASNMIVQGLANGIGAAIPKLVDIGSDFMKRFSQSDKSVGVQNFESLQQPQNIINQQVTPEQQANEEAIRNFMNNN